MFGSNYYYLGLFIIYEGVIYYFQSSSSFEKSPTTKV